MGKWGKSQSSGEGHCTGVGGSAWGLVGSYFSPAACPDFPDL